MVNVAFYLLFVSVDILFSKCDDERVQICKSEFFSQQIVLIINSQQCSGFKARFKINREDKLKELSLFNFVTFLKDFGLKAFQSIDLFAFRLSGIQKNRSRCSLPPSLTFYDCHSTPLQQHSTALRRFLDIFKISRF